MTNMSQFWGLYDAKRAPGTLVAKYIHIDTHKHTVGDQELGVRNN
jgi:hypothetical protein